MILIQKDNCHQNKTRLDDFHLCVYHLKCMTYYTTRINIIDGNILRTLKNISLNV